ncbi:MAG: ABC transporter substrate-binding protein [Anaerolineaceae bacterium]|nr:ABC transporter substrate-binding protein [Anaerolineaceae bacterium]
MRLCRKALCAILAMLVLFSGCVFKKSTEETVCPPIQIGVILAENDSGIGQEQKDGYEFALQEINEAGGIFGCPIELSYQDEGKDADIETAQVAVLDLADEGVVAILGATSSDATMRTAAIASYFKIPLVIPAEIGDEVTQRSNQWIFRLNTANISYSNVAFNMIKSELGTIANVAILFERTAYGESAAVSAATSAMERGLEVVGYEGYSSAAADYSAIIEHVELSQPDAFYIISSDATQAQNLLTAIEDQYLDGKIIIGHGSGFAGRDFLYNGNNDLNDGTENIMMVMPWSKDMPWHGIEKFCFEFDAYAGYPAVSHNVEAYVALQVVREALEEVVQNNQVDWMVELEVEEFIMGFREALAQALRDFRGSDHETVLGPVEFGASGQSSQEAILVQVIEGQLYTIYPPAYAVHDPVYIKGW